MIKKLTAWLLLAILLCSLLPAAQAAERKISYTGTVKESSLHLRKAPSIDGKVINTYKKGTKVEILENDGAWCKVRVGKRTGYMMTAHLDIQADYPHLGWGKTENNGKILNIRSKADAASGILWKGMSGATFELVSESGSWYEVRVGERFGYLEKAQVKKTDGSFAVGFSSAGGEGRLNAAFFSRASREVGSPMTAHRTEGGLTVTFSYPDLGLNAADKKIDAWLEQVRTACQEDFSRNHADRQGALTVEYQALKIGKQYESVVLMAEYTVDGLSAESVLTLNIDRTAGKVLSGAKLFDSDSRKKALFCLESGVTSLMSGPTEGYTGKPDSGWLQYACLGKNGVEVYLPAGLYLPVSLGSRQVNLTYYQLADCLALNSDFLAAYKRVIDPNKPMLALTFDDGPSEQTDRIVNILAQYNARATFCVIGSKVEGFSDVLMRTAAQGNEIASHTWSHPKLTEKSASTIRSQLTRTNKAIKDITGLDVRVLRPPYGAVNKNVRSACKDNGMVIATWNIDTLDWKSRNTNKVYKKIMNGAKNGNIILMHDLYATTAAAVEKAVPLLVEKGFQLVTVSELLSYHKDGVKPGTVYSSLDEKNMKTTKTKK